MSVEELGQAIRDTAHILWPDEKAFIGTYRPMLAVPATPCSSSAQGEVPRRQR